MSTTIFNIAAQPVYKPVFTATLLNHAQLPEAAAVIQRTYDTLPEEKKHFIKKLELTDLRRHVLKGFPVVGITDNQGLVVACCLLSSTKDASLLNNVDGYPDQLLTSDGGLIQCVSVDPSSRGHNLAEMLLETAEEIASEYGLMEIIAKSANTNSGSTAVFQAASYEIAATGYDPDKGYAANYWRKKIPAASSPLVKQDTNGPNQGHDNSFSPAFG